MGSDVWLFVFYGSGLFYLLIHPERVRDKNRLRGAWIAYAVAIAVMAGFTAIQAAADDGSDRRKMEQVAEGLTLGGLAVSMFLVLGAALPSAGVGYPSRPPDEE